MDRGENLSFWSKIALVDSTSPAVEQLSIFHDGVIILITSIGSLVLWILIRGGVSSFRNLYLVEGAFIERA